ncbi:hypothetical protein CRG98_003646 [Punica granatum]|uniref:Uncharacterized protein n=1 Tax=Punica granatum TaxID=22663 RepID=A0A2I0L5M1_PUNGR|nr:hypothetical protein CRG98_003646 [Punica granatum]
MARQSKKSLCILKSISLFRAKIVLSGEQCTRHQPAGPVARRHARAPARSRVRLCRRSHLSPRTLVCPYTSDIPSRACMHIHVPHVRDNPSACLHSSVFAPAHSRAPNRAPEPLVAPMHASASPVACPACSNMDALAPEHPAEDSTESPAPSPTLSSYPEAR